MTRPPATGDTAPAFSLPTDLGSSVRLSDLQGQPVVLYFYPKDDTEGCTKEACGFRDHWREIQRAGATVLGVSPDDVGSHAKFRRKYSLPFPLLADLDHAVTERYGAWGEKSMYGRKYFGVLRTTFLIDRKGRVARVWEKVKVKDHADDVLAAIRALDNT
ncbi:MAG: thioredoxin-dependent thiol peroxidase [Gemmatimonadales bacterium]